LGCAPKASRAGEGANGHDSRGQQRRLDDTEPSPRVQRTLAVRLHPERADDSGAVDERLLPQEEGFWAASAQGPSSIFRPYPVVPMVAMPYRAQSRRIVTYRVTVSRTRPRFHQHSRLRSQRLIAAGLSGLLGISVVAGLAAQPSSAAATSAVDLSAFTGQRINWHDCGDLECGRLTVPLDYNRTSGTTITLALSRAAHTGSSRQGSLVVNPGGPGASGTSFAGYVASGVTPAVAAEFDIIGFDPRGVDASTPVKCLTGRQTTRWLLTDATPDTPAEIATLVSRSQAMSDGCLRYSPTLARHLGSENTVRDMDILRSALGEEELNFHGYSYGTYLGAKYAAAFPDRVGRFVLDGAVDPQLNGMQVSRGQSTGFQRAISRFAADCPRHRGCTLGTSRAAVLRSINRLLAGLDEHPMRAAGPGSLHQSQALSALFLSMYSPDSWSNLRTALAAAKRGDGSGLLELANISADRTGANKYASNQNSSFYAISCWDFPATPTSAGLATAAATWSKGAAVPEMARAMSWGNAPCSYWFEHSSTAPAPATSTTRSPLVVVGTTFDPATPYAWARALASQLPTSTLLTFIGDGHTAFGNASSCVQRAVDTYLLKGAVPAEGLRCR
jgi:pimeloyl-ACP methyl ester carboxylesterase